MDLGTSSNPLSMDHWVNMDDFSPNEGCILPYLQSLHLLIGDGQPTCNVSRPLDAGQLADVVADHV